MKTYSETITWLAVQTHDKWFRGQVGWKGSVDGCEVAAFIYGKQQYDVNTDVWSEIIKTFGDIV